MDNRLEWETRLHDHHQLLFLLCGLQCSSAAAIPVSVGVFLGIIVIVLEENKIYCKASSLIHERLL